VSSGTLHFSLGSDGAFTEIQRGATDSPQWRWCLAGKTELLERRSERLVDAALERDSPDLDVLNSRDWLGLVDFDVVLDTLALLIVDHVDGVRPAAGFG
jgi:hypothetical protein